MCAQSQPTLCDAMDYSLTVSSAHVLTTTSLPIHLSMDIMVAPILAIVNSAAMNIGVPVSFRIVIF